MRNSNIRNWPSGRTADYALSFAKLVQEPTKTRLLGLTHPQRRVIIEYKGLKSACSSAKWPPHAGPKSYRTATVSPFRKRGERPVASARPF